MLCTVLLVARPQFVCGEFSFAAKEILFLSFPDSLIFLYFLFLSIYLLLFNNKHPQTWFISDDHLIFTIIATNY